MGILPILICWTRKFLEEVKLQLRPCTERRVRYSRQRKGLQDSEMLVKPSHSTKGKESPEDKMQRRKRLQVGGAGRACPHQPL